MMHNSKKLVLRGTGIFYDLNEKREYVLEAIFLPSSPAGKDLSVVSIDIEDCTEWRTYTEGIIKEFEIDSIEYL